MDFRGRVFFVSPAISLRRSLDADFRGMEIGPADTRFAAERAVALVNEVRSLWDFDADSAAEAGELQHSRIISSYSVRKAAYAAAGVQSPLACLPSRLFRAGDRAAILEPFRQQIDEDAYLRRQVTVLRI